MNLLGFAWMFAGITMTFFNLFRAAFTGFALEPLGMFTMLVILIHDFLQLNID